MRTVTRGVGLGLVLSALAYSGYLQCSGQQLTWSQNHHAGNSPSQRRYVLHIEPCEGGLGTQSRSYREALALWLEENPDKEIISVIPCEQDELLILARKISR